MQPTLFKKNIKKFEPLSARMTPVSLEEYEGQEHLVDPDKPLRKLIELDQIPSSIFFGPTGCGKTALARIIAKLTKSNFVKLNAVSASVKDVRQVCDEAKYNLEINHIKTILFLDEIHRFNKGQQDVLLNDLEFNIIKLLGATTVNPRQSLNNALLSRTTIFSFEPLSYQNMKNIFKRALADNEKGLGKYSIDIDKKSVDYIIRMSNGDARVMLNILENIVLIENKTKDNKLKIDINIIKEFVSKTAFQYDKDGSSHYNTISAFQKSIRGSDPNASIYWLAVMLEGGEDPLFITRRLIVCAAEDIGLADPNALNVAVNAHNAILHIGLPEGRIPLAMATIYLATAPKSNSAYKAIDTAINHIQKEGVQPIPYYLKTDFGKAFINKDDNEKKYQYPHKFLKHFVKQDYLLEKLKFYFPDSNETETKIKSWITQLWGNDYF